MGITRDKSTYYSSQGAPSCKWLTTMVIVRHQDLGQKKPFQMAMKMAEINAAGPNYLIC